MPRVFIGLAAGLMIVLVGAAGLGLAGDRSAPDRHILMAVFALLLSCLVQVIVFTYLTVTGKMVAQALHLSHADLEPLETVKRIKRSATRLVGLIVLLAVPSVATGASLWRTDGEGHWHYWTAYILVAGHLFAFYRQYALIVENARLLDSVLSQYRRIRANGS